MRRSFAPETPDDSSVSRGRSRFASREAAERRCGRWSIRPASPTPRTATRSRAGARGYFRMPLDWERVAVRRVGVFVTSETFRRPDGSIVEWNSRCAPQARSGDTVGLDAVGAARARMVGGGAVHPWLGLLRHRPRARVSRVGRFHRRCRDLLRRLVVLHERGGAAVHRGRRRAAPRRGRRRRARRPFLGIEPRRIDWWAAAVQLAGTLYFNRTTFNALRKNLDATQARHLIWTPDMLGSICFLVASELAFAEVGHRLWSWVPRSRTWRITALNLLGSVAFGVSAVASFVLPTTGAPASVWLTNAGTFVGAVLLPGRCRAAPARANASRDARPEMAHPEMTVRTPTSQVSHSPCS